MKEDGNAIETVICGGVAGLVNRFCIAPLDVLKIRLQLQSSERLYTGILHGFRTIIRQEGITGLWKGNVSAEILYVTYSASQFLAYKELTAACERWLPSGVVPAASHSFIAGAGAGAVATVVTYPFDLFRTRFAAQGPTTRVYGGLYHAVRHVVRHEGYRGMYRGLTASVTQIVPYMGLLFGTYEPCRLSLAYHGVPTGWDSALAGFIAGSCSKTGVFPLDLIRKRLQVQGPTRKAYFLSTIPVYHSSMACVVQIFQREGIRGFYKGLGVSLLKSAPSSAITLWTFEQSARLLHFLKDKSGHVKAS